MNERILLLLAWIATSHTAGGQELELIQLSQDGRHFVGQASGQPIMIWGVNYDHDAEGQLLDEYWQEDWPTVVSDFREIKELGANSVRVHMQLGKLMRGPDEPNPEALRQLRQLVAFAEECGLYLNITGLACYHKQNVPDWYDALAESDRWSVQMAFWEAVASTCAESPAVFCYDLMNEPILPGKKAETDWLAGELGGKYFVQRLTLKLDGRTRQQVAEAWVSKMVEAIRKHDAKHLVTVGVIPWVFTFGGGKPLFYSSPVVEHLDFVSVHFYPKAGEVDQAIEALNAYQVGKPLVIEEMFPLRCSADELVEFIAESKSVATGWFSFYWGRTASELRNVDSPRISEAITAAWLDRFQQLAPEMKSGR